MNPQLRPLCEVGGQQHLNRHPGEKVVKLSSLVLVICASLVGCASVPMGDARQDQALKTFAVAPDKAGIYIYRSDDRGGAVKMDVHLDGVPLGQTATKTYLYSAVAPGKHTISSILNGADTLEVEVNAGSLAYVRQDLKAGFFRPHTRLHLVSEAEGRKGVLQTRLAESISRMQAIKVRVEADDPAWGGPLECQASNASGNWPFAAPGTVTVQASTSALQIKCKAPVGASAETSTMAPGGAEAARKGSAAGAKVGAGAGVALGLWAAPIMGPAALIFAVGGAFRGSEIGGIVGSVTANDRMGYPDPIVVRIKRAAPSD